MALATRVTSTPERAVSSEHATARRRSSATEGVATASGVTPPAIESDTATVQGAHEGEDVCELGGAVDDTDGCDDDAAAAVLLRVWLSETARLGLHDCDEGSAAELDVRVGSTGLGAKLTGGDAH